MSEPIVVDIGEAIAALTASPELAAKIGELVAPMYAEQIAAADRLHAAVLELYFAANWKADRVCDEARLWTQVRDEAGIVPGKSTAVLRSATNVLPV